MIVHRFGLVSAFVLLCNCGGGTPLQAESKECDPSLGLDACAAGLTCETRGDTSTCVLPRSQQASEPCDMDYGVDACGAGLFCAAFDGREIATCYQERSRGPGQECIVAENCANGRCTSGHCALGAKYESCINDSDCASGKCDLGPGGLLCE
ncbi:Hypothetical protein A7982_11362 [Minicystis rosea]|nr:Hypothetical protein A7982_11362 [Minicystis rosea]